MGNKSNILNIGCNSEKMQAFCGTREEADILNDEYWRLIHYKEKIRTITYLRECFYGKEATTGRIQRFYKLAKFK